MERPGRVAVGVALDAAVRRVGRLPGDAGDLERAAADPGAVVVTVGQEDRTSRDDGVQVDGQRVAVGERRHRPAAAEDPLVVRPPVGVGADRREVLLAGRVLGQVAAQSLQPALDRVDVGVGEAGRDESFDLDDVGPSGLQPGADRHDPAVTDQDVPAPQVPVPVEDGAAAEQRAQDRRPSSSGPAGSWVMPTFFAASPDSASRQTRLARNAVISAWS